MVTVWRRKRQQGKYTNAWLVKRDHQHRLVRACMTARRQVQPLFRMNNH